MQERRHARRKACREECRKEGTEEVGPCEGWGHAFVCMVLDRGGCLGAGLLSSRPGWASKGQGCVPGGGGGGGGGGVQPALAPGVQAEGMHARRKACRRGSMRKEACRKEQGWREEVARKLLATCLQVCRCERQEGWAAGIRLAVGCKASTADAAAGGGPGWMLAASAGRGWLLGPVLVKGGCPGMCGREPGGRALPRVGGC
jgi:hypothetical protein